MNAVDSLSLRHGEAERPVTTSGGNITWLLASVVTGPWLVWGSSIAQDHGLLDWRIPQGLALWSMLPGLVLALAATGGRTALRELAARMVRWRAPVWVYGIGLFAPMAIAGSAAAIVACMGEAVPLGRLMSLPAASGYLFFGIGLFLLTEEAAWRGTLLPLLQDRLGPTAGSLVVGIIWGLWHLPLLASPGEHDRGLPVLPFLLLIVATSVLVSALVNAARGSVVVAALFHASFDASYSYVGVVGPEHTMMLTAAAVTTVAAVALIAATRGRLFLTREAAA